MRQRRSALNAPRLAALLIGVAAGAACAQPTLGPYAEYRADVIVGRGTAVQGGGGVVVPLGPYVRFGVVGAAGATVRDGVTRASGRVDAISRFLLDPYREIPVGVSVGAGMSLPATQGDARLRPYLTAVVDVEGRMRGPFTPALQIGLGGGTRLGVVLRTSVRRWR